MIKPTKTYTIHIGQWIKEQCHHRRNNVTGESLATVLNIKRPTINGWYDKHDWPINGLLAALEHMNASLSEILLDPKQIRESQQGFSVSDPAEAYDSSGMHSIKLERDLLRERLADKDALIAALQAQLAR